MERRRYKKERGDSKLISDIIVSLCADYDRRKRVICEKSASKRVRMEYAYINTRILDAAGETVGLGAAELFIREIGNSVGYAESKIDYMGEPAYKVMKSRIKKNIAKKLHLWD